MWYRAIRYSNWLPSTRYQSVFNVLVGRSRDIDVQNTSEGVMAASSGVRLCGLLRVLEYQVIPLVGCGGSDKDELLRIYGDPLLLPRRTCQGLPSLN